MNAMPMMSMMPMNMNPMMMGSMIGMNPMMMGMPHMMMGMNPMMNGAMPMMNMMPMMACEMSCKMTATGMMCEMKPAQGMNMEMFMECCKRMAGMMDAGMPMMMMCGGMPMMMNMKAAA